ncbi:ATPase [Mangrovimicrobium sediminis]|uniref:ATPase n=1 Tax=Mangrovimicrobium sediminis TaxID=2562682 RepID=A0A4Z0M5Q5_9GAMM|nr:ATPase [Haliea sp. SAOS-164]TGD74829.1 ATPase [Haliea sp. SAOS-164]
MNNTTKAARAAARFSGVPALLLLAFSLLVPVARAEVLGVNVAGFALRVEAVAPVPLEQAWTQLVHPERWWNPAHTWSGDHANLSLALTAGGCFCERAEGLDVQHMVVSQVRPQQSLVMLGGLGPLQAMGLSGAASFVLSATDDGGTRLVHEYRVSGYAAEGFAQLAPIVDAVQQGQVDHWAASLTP